MILSFLYLFIVIYINKCCKNSSSVVVDSSDALVGVFEVRFYVTMNVVDGVVEVRFFKYKVRQEVWEGQ